jgi:outer membrane protein insertion porin family
LGGALDTLAEQTPLEGEPIQEVRVEGNQRIDAAAILENLETKAKGQLRSSSIDQDIRSIYAMGYFDDVRVYTEAIPQGVRVTFQVKERPMILSIRFEGNKKLKEDKLKEALLVKEHTILDPAKVQEGITAIRKRYREEGYFFATVSSRIEPKEGNTADVVYKINENKAVKVVEITFQGNEHFKEKELNLRWPSRRKGFFRGLRVRANLRRRCLRPNPCA